MGLVTLFKSLGREPQAAEIIKRYIEARSNDRSAFDLDNDPFAGNVTDPDVIEALRSKYQSFKEQRSPREILLGIAETHSWNDEDINILATLSTDQYYDLFKASKGVELRRLIRTCLEFDTIQNASESMKEIPMRSREALKRIGSESSINALRVRRFGISVST